MKERQIKTHVVDGTREGVFGALAVGVAMKIAVLPAVIMFADPVLSVPALAGVLTALFKTFRNYARKNWGVSFGGSI